MATLVPVVCGLLAWQTPKVKPTAPVSLELDFGTPPVAGEEAELVFTAKPHLDVEILEMTVQLPPAIAFRRGKLTWKGMASLGEIRNVELVVRLPEVDGETTISAQARLTGPGFEHEKKTELNIIVRDSKIVYGDEEFPELRKKLNRSAP